MVLKLTDYFSLANAREYFERLSQKIISEDLTQIIFKSENDFFVTDQKRGVRPKEFFNSSKIFHYRLKLPTLAESSNNEKLKDKLNVLNTTALRIQPFKSGYAQITAFA